MSAPKYDAETVAKAAELRERGMTQAAIARQLDMSIGAVGYHCLRLGADSPPELRRHTPKRKPIAMRRGNHVVRMFTEEEDQTLLRMEAQGMRLSDIAKAMNRQRNSIVGRLMTLARREERNTAG